MGGGGGVEKRSILTDVIYGRSLILGGGGYGGSSIAQIVIPGLQLCKWSALTGGVKRVVKIDVQGVMRSSRRAPGLRDLMPVVVVLVPLKVAMKVKAFHARVGSARSATTPILTPIYW